MRGERPSQWVRLFTRAGVALIDVWEPVSYETEPFRRGTRIVLRCGVSVRDVLKSPDECHALVEAARDVIRVWEAWPQRERERYEQRARKGRKQR